MNTPAEIRILVVEDEYLVAVAIESILVDAGYAVAGPMPTVQDALEFVAAEPSHLALLDVNVAGHFVYPVADALSSRQVPFIFLSGCEGADLPPRFSHIPILIKPFSAEHLLQAIDQVLGRPV